MPDVNTAVLMFIAQRHAEARVLQHLHEHGFADMTIAQGRIAARLDQEGMRLTDLAAAAQVTKQTAAFLVGQLEQAGYVERRPDPTDARARLICIAERGVRAQAEARVVEQRIETEWTRHLGRDRMRELRRALTDLRAVTDPWMDAAE